MHTNLMDVLISGQAFYYNTRGQFLYVEDLWGENDLKYVEPVRLNPPKAATSVRIRQWTSNDMETYTKDVFVSYTPSLDDGKEFTYTNVLDAVGYKENKRLSASTGEERDNTGTDLTGWIPVKQYDTIYLKNVTMPVDSTNNDATVGLYYSDKSKKTCFIVTSSMNSIATDDDGNVVKITLGHSDIAYLRISAGNIDENSIITVNELIE